MEPLESSMTPGQVRLAFAEVLADTLNIDNTPECVEEADRMLVRLWVKGLKVVPNEC